MELYDKYRIFLFRVTTSILVEVRFLQGWIPIELQSGSLILSDFKSQMVQPPPFQRFRMEFGNLN